MDFARGNGYSGPAPGGLGAASAPFTSASFYRSPRPEVQLDAETLSVGATLSLQKDSIVLPQVPAKPLLQAAAGGADDTDAIIFRGPAASPTEPAGAGDGSTSLVDLLHPAARQLCRRNGPHHATLATLLDCVIGFGVAVTTSCGRRYHGLLASVEDADMSIIIEECVQEKKGGKGHHRGVMILPGASILSIDLVTPEPVPLFDPCVGDDYAAGGANLSVLLNGYHTWPFPDAAAAAESSPAAPECVRFLEELRRGEVPRPASMALDGSPAGMPSANVFNWPRHHHGHTMVLNGLVSARTGARRLGKGAAYTPGSGPAFR